MLLGYSFTSSHKTFFFFFFSNSNRRSCKPVLQWLLIIPHLPARCCIFCEILPSLGASNDGFQTEGASVAQTAEASIMCQRPLEAGSPLSSVKISNLIQRLITRVMQGDQSDNTHIIIHLFVLMHVFHNPFPC